MKTQVSTKFNPVKVVILLESEDDLYAFWHRMHSLPRIFNPNVPRVEGGFSVLCSKLTKILVQRGYWGRK